MDDAATSPSDLRIMPIEATAQQVIDLWEAGADRTEIGEAIAALDSTLHRMNTGPAPSKINLRSTIREAAAWLKARLVEGAPCPACGQTARLYRRKITSTMAAALVIAWREAGIEYVHFPSLVGAARADEAKLVHWGLIEEEQVLRPDGGRAGWWRVTDKGVDFIHGRITVPKYAWLYNKRCVGHDGDQVTIGNCLGDPFRLDELLGRALPLGA